MHRYRRRSAPAIIALATLFSGPAVPQEEFAGQQLVACVIDIPVHCASARPGGGRIVNVFKTSVQSLRPNAGPPSCPPIS